MHRIVFFVSWMIPFIGFAQTARDYAVLMQTTAQSESSILITWDNHGSALSHTLFKKFPDETAWGSPISTLGGGDTSYLDADVESGIEYEYSVRRGMGGFTAYGYSQTGVNVQLPADRGNLLLITTDSVNFYLEGEVATLIDDMSADGWSVTNLVVSEEDTPEDVKELIIDANQAQDGIEMIYLLGHVPVPYAGEIAPDAHNNHVGAWPADVYYADIDGTWTDNSVNNTTASDARNHNVPNDGKFDNSTLPSLAEIMIGRVDFANMPAFAKGEMALLKAYLDRVHHFKQRVWDLPRRALVDDNFGGFNGEAFASSAWRNFSPLIGRDQIFAGDYRTTLDTLGHLFSYGCGGGSFTSANGIGNTSQLSTDSLQTGFTMLFGSYFGDWDRPDNFMRAALAQGNTMSISWAGRPHWFYHSMGVGHPIGHSALRSQNNLTTYTNQVNFATRWVHSALLGDPTLRMEYLSPPTALVLDTVDTFHVSLSWQASSETGVGYNVYRKLTTEWIRLNEEPISSTSWIDSCVLDSGSYSCMVKTTKLTELYSGSYYNESLGAMAEIEIVSSKAPRATHWFVDQQNSNPPVGNFRAETFWATYLEWHVEGEILFGNNVQYEPQNVGSGESLSYQVFFGNTCETLSGQSNHTLDIRTVFASEDFKLFPNPVSNGSTIQIDSDYPINSISVYSANGSQVFSSDRGSHSFTADFGPGMYYVKLTSNGQTVIQNFVIN